MKKEDLVNGMKVRVKEGHKPLDNFKGEAIYHGNDTTTKDENIALERLDGQSGAAQNGWWTFSPGGIEHLEPVEEIEEVIENTTEIAIDFDYDEIKSVPKK